MELNLYGKGVVVTGAARGIGRATTAEFARAGANVVIADLLADEAHATAAELSSQHGVAVYAFTTDVANLENVRALRDYAVEKLASVDVLVNNVGYDRSMPFLQTDPDFWEMIIDVNFRGALNMCHAFLPHMAAQKSGAIVNIASDAGRSGSLGESVYSGCKAGIIAFSKTLAREHARDNIRVNVVSPGITKTALYDEAIETEFGEKVMAAIVRAIPLGRRPGAPEEIAPAIVFLASDAASYITGQVLSVNGGLSMVD